MKYKTNKKRRFSVMAVCLLLTVLTAAGATLAYLYDGTESVVNTFTVPGPDITVEEEFEGGVKQKVTVENTGDVTSFVRAKVIINWKNEDGTIYPKTPVRGTDRETADYKITWVKDGWTQVGDFYYCNSPVEPGKSTGVLFTDARPLRACENEDYELHIEIIVQSVQSSPAEAVKETWGVTIANGGVSPVA